jgi:hypothetical protein
MNEKTGAGPGRPRPRWRPAGGLAAAAAGIALLAAGRRVPAYSHAGSLGPRRPLRVPDRDACQRNGRYRG